MANIENSKIVVGLGEVLWDVLPSGKQLGGAPANFAYHISQMGHQSCAVSAIGDDELGREILEVLADKSMGKYFPVVDYPTGTVAVTLDDNGVPAYDIKEGAAWDNIPFGSELESLASRTICVCFGSLAQRNSISRDSITKFLKAMPNDEATLKVFDINLRQHYYSREIIESSLAMSNIFKINDEELEVITPLLNICGESVEERAKEIVERYKLKYLIITCGTDGSYIFDRLSSSFMPTPRVEVADTVGAGDSFTAAFCGSILSGSSMVEAHTLAVKVSAFVCTQKGAMPLLAQVLK